MGNEQSRKQENSLGMELDNIPAQPGRIQTSNFPATSIRSNFSGIPLNAPEQPVSTQANTSKLKLELVRAEVTKLEFKYGQGSDCKMLAMETIDIAKRQGIKATLKELQKPMLVEKGKIKGDTRQSNTEGKNMWFFQEHFWCEIEGIVYDPLFNQLGKPNMIDLETNRPNYKDCYK
jgi:hypothetical protein